MTTTTRALTLSAALLGLLGASACVGSAEVRKGPAFKQRPVRVILTPAFCGSVENLCSDSMVEGTNLFVQNELAFAGFEVVDAVKLAQEARTRDTSADDVKRFGEKVLRAANPRQHGKIFAGLSPQARQAMLKEAQADGIVTVGIQLGAADGIGPGRTHQVIIRLSIGSDDDLVWVTRCTADSNLYPDIEMAVDNAARCALSGALEPTKATPSEAS